MSASVVSCVDAAPVLEACEEVLDLVSLPIQDWVVAVLDAVLSVRRDARGNTTLLECVAEGDGTVGPVGEQMAGWGQVLEQCCGTPVVAGLALHQIQQQRAPLAIADHLQLGGQAASAASDTSG